MPTNDQIILGQILDEKYNQVSSLMDYGSFFEIYTSEQILKDFDLSYEDIQRGIVGSSGDGGIDGAYVFVNGDLVQEDTEDFSHWRKNIVIELAIIQSKTSNGFSEDAILKFISVSKDLLNLSKNLDDFKSVYNASLLEVIERFRKTVTSLASKFPKIKFSYYYSTKGDDVHPNVERQVSELKSTIEQLFTGSEFTFEFVGATELLAIARRQPTRVLTLEISENPMSSRGEVFICLVKLKEFYNFIIDENGKLRRHIFESNVRDYQGSTIVNKEIQQTLENPNDEEDFWWLNNGVTILATKATAQGGKALTIEDPEIVNGLQTSNEIYNFFQENSNKEDNRTLLVRVIVPRSEESRDNIIKATNSQTKIPAVSLRATDKIHRDIEEFLKPRGFYYDRRKNFYKNEGKPVTQIIGLSYMAQALMAILIQKPDTARARPSTLLQRDEEYTRIFNSDNPIGLYYAVIKIMKRVELFLKEEISIEIKDKNNIKFYLAFAAVIYSLGKANPTILDIAGLDANNISSDILNRAYTEIMEHYQALGGTDQVAKGTQLIENLKETFESRYSRVTCPPKIDPCKSRG